MTTKQINELIQDQPNPELNTNEISDGFHTFGELYDHRIQLWIALCKMLHIHGHHSVWKTKAHSDGSIWGGWFLLGVTTSSGEQLTYHLPEEHYDLLVWCPELEKAPDYDGHTSADVLERLKTL